MANDKDFFSDVEGMDGLDDGAEEAPAQVRKASQSVAAVVEDLYEEQEQQASGDDLSEVDAQMAAVEQRLEIAQFYKLLLGHELFGEAYQNNKAAQRVQREVRVYARERLGVLMGVTQEKREEKVQVESPFSDVEVTTLKQIAATMIQRAQQAGKPVPPPTLKPVEKTPPAAPAAPKPALQAMKPPEKPQVRAATAPKPQVPAPKPATAAAPAPTKNKQLALMWERVPEQYRKDPTLKVERGRVLVQARTTDGEPIYVHDKEKGTKEPFFKDITLPAKPAAGSPQPLPTPSIAQYSMVMQQQADEALMFADRKARSLGISDQMAVAAAHGFARNEE